MLRQESSLTLLFLRFALAACATAGTVEASAQPYVAVGQCRSGVANGAYELRMPDGHLRVVGAFAQGRMTGTFIFWNATGARIAVLPLDNDVRSGTIALWYTAPDGRTESGHKLEAPYVEDRPHGIKRSWHPSGAPRAEYRYEYGILTEARAWSEAGAPLPESEAASLAARDAEAEEQLYASLLALVRENLPACDEDGTNGPGGPSGQPPRS